MALHHEVPFHLRVAGRKEQIEQFRIRFYEPVPGIRLAKVVNRAGGNVEACVIMHAACLPEAGIYAAAATDVEHAQRFSRLADVTLQHRFQRLDAAGIDLAVVDLAHGAVADDRDVRACADTFLPVGAGIKAAGFFN